ncbi:MAG TPA: hypothetical protein VNJ07_07975 [Chitinophagales bacterium]|nr:hypothetical protein [Chitinophagales bacterium]
MKKRFGGHPMSYPKLVSLNKRRKKMKRQIEIFTAGCPVCNPVVDLVKSLVFDSCEVTVYDVVKQCGSKECLSKVEQYAIKRLPAIAVNGELLNCCIDKGITKEDLIAAGIGKSL